MYNPEAMKKNGEEEKQKCPCLPGVKFAITDIKRTPITYKHCDCRKT